MRKIREEGISGIIRHERSDRGEARIEKEWQEFIEKTYREGNQGSRRMTAAQVAVRVKARAKEKGIEKYPSRMTVYRLLKPLKEKEESPKRSLGWKGERLALRTREGIEIGIEWSNQVWQCDHTRADILVVDRSGEILGRPWLTLVVDTYSRCLMGMHLGFDPPSAAVVCLALRHAILPKQYSSAYELRQTWETYGIPQYLYTDSGKDFRSRHLEQVTLELGIVPCLRQKPSEVGIVERPFGTINSEFFSSLPGYTGSNVVERSSKAESEASLTLMQLERLLVRYLVDNYNQRIDARMGDQSRIGRWEAGRIAQLPLRGERELDNCLMRRENRRVYRQGYLQFASLSYAGEHLAAYEGETVIIRYAPRDITTIWVYQQQEKKEIFLTRAHATGWETESLSHEEARAISQRRRRAGEAISNRSMLEEIRDRDEEIEENKRQKRKKSKSRELPLREERSLNVVTAIPASEVEPSTEAKIEVTETEPKKKPVPYVNVIDYEELKRRGGMW